MPRAAARFIRFAIQGNDPGSGRPQGLFFAAGEVCDDPTALPYEIDRIRAITRWFDKHLAQPTRFDRNRSKQSYDLHKRGISWFKASATEHISMMRELAAVLISHGHVIDQIETDRPGYVVYEDEFQIVAEPFADTPTSR